MKSGFRDIVQVVIAGMPPGGETRCVADIIMDDVHAGYAGDIIDVIMIVRDRIRLLVGEHRSVAQFLRRAPDYLLIIGCVLRGLHLPRENSIRSTNHIEHKTILIDRLRL